MQAEFAQRGLHGGVELFQKTGQLLTHKRYLFKQNRHQQQHQAHEQHQHPQFHQHHRQHAGQQAPQAGIEPVHQGGERIGQYGGDDERRKHWRQQPQRQHA